MISRKQIVWVLAGVLFVAFGAAVGQEGSEPPKRPPVESPVPEEGGGDTGEAGGAEANQDKPGEGAGSAPGDKKGQGDGLFSNWLLPVMIGGLLLMFLLSSRGRKKRDRKRQEMLAALKKGAKVTTIGGIIGTVMEVREDEVTVKVDEQNNVRMRFSRRAIQGVGDEARKDVGDQNR